MSAIQARPTLYKGIKMRSRLEADYAGYLDRRGLAWEYEPIAFGGPDSQWLPDFRLPHPPPYAHTYIELKPASQLECLDGELYEGRLDRIDQILRRMSVTWLSEPQVTLILEFWKYGEGSLASIIGSPGRPWTCDGGLSFAVLWPGMGQWEALPECNREAS